MPHSPMTRRLSSFAMRLARVVNPKMELSPNQVKFALALENQLSKCMDQAHLESSGVLVTEDLCLHHSVNQALNFGWMEKPAFTCLGCAKPQGKRNVLGCKVCVWEVCPRCQAKVYTFFKALGRTHHDIPRTLKTYVTPAVRRTSLVWAEQKMQGLLRPQVVGWMRDVVVTEAVIFILCVVAERQPTRATRLPSELLRCVADMLGRGASLNLPV